MIDVLMSIANTGDNSKPWLIAICMIVSIIVVAALFILGKKDEDDNDKENHNLW